MSSCPPVSPRSLEECRAALQKVRCLATGSADASLGRRAYAKIFFPMNALFVEEKRSLRFELWMDVLSDIRHALEENAALKTPQLYVLMRTWAMHAGKDIQELKAGPGSDYRCSGLARFGRTVIYCLLEYRDEEEKVEEFGKLCCKFASAIVSVQPTVKQASDLY